MFNFVIVYSYKLECGVLAVLVFQNTFRKEEPLPGLFPQMPVRIQVADKPRLSLHLVLGLPCSLV